MTIEIKLKQADAERALDQSLMDPRAFEDRLERAMTESVIKIRSDATLVPPMPYRTGTLRRSLAFAVERDGPFVVGAVGSNLPYARLQEQGGTFTRTSAWGRPTAPYSVTYKGRGFLEKAIKKNRDHVRRRFAAVLLTKKR